MLYPMFAMVILTFAIGIFTAVIRVRSVMTGKVKARYYKLMQGEAPEIITKTSRHFSNLFEVPVLFYTVGVLFVALHIEDSLATGFGWGFFVFRCVHAFIHLTHNHPLHRMAAFMAANVCVIGLWVLLAMRVS